MSLRALDDRHLARFEENHPASMLENGRDIRGDEHLTLPQPDHHPAGIADAGGDDLIRLERRQHHHPVGALQVEQGAPTASVRLYSSAR